MELVARPTACVMIVRSRPNIHQRLPVGGGPTLVVSGSSPAASNRYVPSNGFIEAEGKHTARPECAWEMSVDEATAVQRLHRTFTVTCHYLFLQLTMGLALLIVIVKTIAVRSDGEHYGQAACFWAKPVVNSGDGSIGRILCLRVSPVY